MTTPTKPTIDSILDQCEWGYQCGITYPTPEPSEDWEEELKLYLTSAGDRRRTVHFIKKLLVKKEKALIEKIEKNLVNIFPKEGSIKENKDWSTSEREMYEDCLTAIQHYLNSLQQGGKEKEDE